MPVKEKGFMHKVTLTSLYMCTLPHNPCLVLLKICKKQNTNRMDVLEHMKHDELFEIWRNWGGRFTKDCTDDNSLVQN